MKYASLAVAGLLAATVNAHAFEQQDLDKLKATGSCEGCDLKSAYLKQANLQGANLRQANFVADEDSGLSGADLTHAIFRNADLSDAKLSEVTGLLADKLAGADLSNTKLPPDIAKFVGLAQVAEISRHARNNFLAILGGCVFSGRVDTRLVRAKHGDASGVRGAAWLWPEPASG